MRTILTTLLMMLLPNSVNTAIAIFASPTLAPIDRVIKNTESYLKEHPGDPNAHYTLARVHYLAFTHRILSVGIQSQYTPPRINSDGFFMSHTDIIALLLKSLEPLNVTLKEYGLSSRDDVTEDIRSAFNESLDNNIKKCKENGLHPDWYTQRRLLGHAANAKAHFEKALKLAPENGLYHLGLASLYRQYLQYSARVKLEAPGQGFEEISSRDAKKHFYHAFAFSVKDDAKIQYRPMTGLKAFVSYEAGQAYIKLSEESEKHNRHGKKKLARVKKALKELNKKPSSGIVTPIVFSFREHASLSELLAPSRVVMFDLDGDGTQERWSWVKPHTGFLVWDPQGSRRIMSGRQLFGSATWWILFSNGYVALDSLDDNRDGCLTGSESNGISVWFDKNSNAISESFEVVSLQSLGIASISTGYSECDGIPFNDKGIALRDGTYIPTYDWITSPIEDNADGYIMFTDL